MNSLNDILEEKTKVGALVAQKKYSQAETSYKKLLEESKKIWKS